MNAEIVAPGNRGPALLYIHTDRESSTFVDQVPVTDPRERAICRALLEHAMALLDASEPTSAVAGGVLRADHLR